MDYLDFVPIDITNDQIQSLNQMVNSANIGDEENIYTNYINFSKYYIKVYVHLNTVHLYKREIKSNLWFYQIFTLEKNNKKELSPINNLLCDYMSYLFYSLKNNIEYIGENLYLQLKKSLKLNKNFWGKSISKTTLFTRKKISIENFLIDDINIFLKFQEKFKKNFYIIDYKNNLFYFDYTSNNFELKNLIVDKYDQYNNSQYSHNMLDLIFMICSPYDKICTSSMNFSWIDNKIDDNLNFKNDIDYLNYLFQNNFDVEYNELLDVLYLDYENSIIRPELLKNKDDSNNLIFMIKKIFTRFFNFNEFEFLFENDVNDVNEIIEKPKINKKIHNKINIIISKINDIKMRLAIIKLFLIKKYNELSNHN